MNLPRPPKQSRTEEWVSFILHRLTGDDRHKRDIILASRGVIYPLAQSYYHRNKIPFDDLIDAGDEGVCAAFNLFRFDEYANRFARFAYSYAKYAILNRIEKEKPPLEPLPNWDIQSEEDIVHAYLRNESVRVVRQAMASAGLTAAQHKIFKEYALEGKPMRMLGEQLGYSRAWCHLHLNYAHDKVVKQIKEIYNVKVKKEARSGS